MSSETTGGSTALNGVDGTAVFNNASVARLTRWSINHVMAETAWGDNGTQGYTARRRAREDATGTLVGKYDEIKKPYAMSKSNSVGIPGGVMKLVLWEKRKAGFYWVFPCILVQNFQLTVDMDSKEVVEWTMDWGADGLFWRPGQSSIPSETIPPDEEA